MTEFSFDATEYEPRCLCGAADSIKRERQVYERQYLKLESDGDFGSAYVDSEDMDAYDEFKFICESCGIEGTDLEDILKPREVDEENDD